MIKKIFVDPRQMYVPAEASTAMLIGSSKFRSKARLPVLTYLHSNQASICRCSQPLSGFSARCLEDEQMLEAIRNTNPNRKFMYVVDTRPRVRILFIFSMDFSIPHIIYISIKKNIVLFTLFFGRSMQWQIVLLGKDMKMKHFMKILNFNFLELKIFM